MTSVAESGIYEFGGFRVDASKRLLVGELDESIPLAPKVFDTLLYLVSHSGKVIDKDELMLAIWKDTIVEENNLNKNISVLRRVLGEHPDEHRFIVTVPGKGYKFVADVRSADIETLQIPDPADPVETRKTVRPKFRLVLAAAGSLSLLAVLLAGTVYWQGRSTSIKSGAPQTIAILPFRPLVAENRDEALELGMAATLISRLGNDREVIVRPLSAVRNFSSLEQDAVAAGKALGVETVLDGNIQRWGDKIRVNVRLIKVADGSMLWTDTFDQRFTDIFVVQDEISNRVAKALAFQLSNDGRRRLTKRNTENVEAYQAYLRGRYHLEKYSSQDTRKAIPYFQQAIGLDPSFAAAYASLGAIYQGLAGANDFPRRETLLMARENVLKAIALDDQLSTAHEVYGVILFRFDNDFAGGERELKRAIELDPNDASAHETYGGLLIPLGRHEEALAEMRRAAEINPLSVSISASIGNTLLHARRYDEAVTQYKKALELDSYFTGTHYGLALAYQMLRNYAESIEERGKLNELVGNPKGAAFVRESFAQGGWPGFLRAMTESSQAPQIPQFDKASLFAELGEKDKAFEILNYLLEDRPSSVVMLKVDARFDPLRDDPRFAEILKRLKLE